MMYSRFGWTNKDLYRSMYAVVMHTRNRYNSRLSDLGSMRAAQKKFIKMAITMYWESIEHWHFWSWCPGNYQSGFFLKCINFSHIDNLMYSCCTKNLNSTNMHVHLVYLYIPCVIFRISIVSSSFSSSERSILSKFFTCRTTGTGQTMLKKPFWIKSSHLLCMCAYQFRHYNATQLEWRCHTIFNRENWEI